MQKKFHYFNQESAKNPWVNSEINYSTKIISLNFYLDPTEPSGLGTNLSMLGIL